MTREEALPILDDMYKYYNDCPNYNEYVGFDKYDNEAFMMAYNALKQEPKIGHWIDEGIYADGQNYHAFRCSECEWHYIGNESELVDFKYCPFCGAKMQVVEE